MSNPVRSGECEKPARTELLRSCGTCSARVPRAMVEAAAGLKGKQGCLPPQSTASGFRVEETPGHGSDFVEEVEDSGCAPSVDGVRPCEEADVGVDLFGRGKRDAPVMDSVSAGSPVSLGEVCRHRCRRPDHLIGERLQGSGDSPDEGNGSISRVDCLLGHDEIAAGERVVHGHLRVVHALPNVEAGSDFKGRRRGDSSCP